MRNKIFFYLTSLILLVTCLLFFESARRELIRYTRLINRNNIVHRSFQNLSGNINNAAVLRHDLVKSTNDSKFVILFFTDSLATIQQADLLRSLVRDSVNIQIAEKLAPIIKSELSWILNSNVQDSIVNHKSILHLIALQNIDSLINVGIQRTNVLLDYNEKEASVATQTMSVWLIIFIIFSGALLTYTSIKFFDQRSKRKLKEKELELSQAGLKRIMDSSLDVICSVDAKGCFLQVSAACETMWGYRPDELIGKLMIQFIYHEDQIKTNEMEKSVMAGIGITNFENRYIHKEGFLVPLTWSARWDAKDQTSYAVARNATEKKQSEANLVESETRFRALSDKSTDMKTLLTPEGKVLYGSNSITKFLGYAMNEFIGKNASEFIHCEDVLTGKNIEDLFETPGASLYIEQRMLHKKGNWIWCQGTITNMLHEPGVNALVSNFRDITEKKKGEDEVLRTLTEKNTILESIGDAFFATDNSWTVTYWNKHAEKMLGVPKKDIVGHYLWEVFKDSVDSESYKKYHEAIDSNQVIEFENYHPASQKWYEVSAYPSERGLAVYFKDITERKVYEINLNKLNASLQQQAKALAISNMELEQFAYVASHDLQEPLRMITSFLTQLEKKYGTVIDSKGKQYIEFAVDGAKRMRQIILDLLEYSKIGKTTADQEDIDLNGLVNEIQILFRKKIEECKAIIIVDELPHLYAYRSPMRQVFQNVVGNALTYTCKDRPAKIHITAKELKDQWQFAVEDNGIGIEEEYFEKIFIIFQRLHIKEEYSGTGMGLAITKKILESLGGKIWVESEDGGGSIFYFTIPKN